MLRGLYTATTGMLTNLKKMDAVTNNIANIDTTGYKKDVVLSESFPDVLVYKMNTPVSSLTMEGEPQVEVNQEGNTYHLATTAGFFRVQAPNGISYQRELNFTINEEGYLSTYHLDADGNPDTHAGHLVLGSNGQPIQVGGGNLQIEQDGQVLVNGNVVDNLIFRKPLAAIGTINHGVYMDRIYVNHSQGEIYSTENRLDFAIDGRGFFMVQAQGQEQDQGIRYTRDGSFQLNNMNQLVTSEGYLVLDANQQPIVLNGTEITVSETGEIFVDNQPAGNLGIVVINNLYDLRKEGYNLYRMEEDMEPEFGEFTGRVLQGFLEKSNVNPIREMVEMIQLARNYESNQRVIQAYDHILDKAINDIGRV